MATTIGMENNNSFAKETTVIATATTLEKMKATTGVTSTAAAETKNNDGAFGLDVCRSFARYGICKNTLCTYRHPSSLAEGDINAAPVLATPYVYPPPHPTYMYDPIVAAAAMYGYASGPSPPHPHHPSSSMLPPMTPLGSLAPPSVPPTTMLGSYYDISYNRSEAEASEHSGYDGENVIDVDKDSAIMDSNNTVNKRGKVDGDGDNTDTNDTNENDDNKNDKFDNYPKLPLYAMGNTFVRPMVNPTSYMQQAPRPPPISTAFHSYSHYSYPANLSSPLHHQRPPLPHHPNSFNVNSPGPSTPSSPSAHASVGRPKLVYAQNYYQQPLPHPSWMMATTQYPAAHQDMYHQMNNPWNQAADTTIVAESEKKTKLTKGHQKVEIVVGDDDDDDNTGGFSIELDLEKFSRLSLENRSNVSIPETYSRRSSLAVSDVSLSSSSSFISLKEEEMLENASVESSSAAVASIFVFDSSRVQLPVATKNHSLEHEIFRTPKDGFQIETFSVLPCDDKETGIMMTLLSTSIKNNSDETTTATAPMFGSFEDTMDVSSDVLTLPVTSTITTIGHRRLTNEESSFIAMIGV